MMHNIHAPARYPDETFAEYRLRRQASKEAIVAARRKQPAPIWSKRRPPTFPPSTSRAEPGERQTPAYLRDEHGTFTLTGRRLTDAAGVASGRRKWLAGISMQRGY